MRKVHKLIINKQTIRILTGMQLQFVAGMDGKFAPPPTNGSTAESCQGSKFNCCP